ncbi:MAG: ATP-binding cassette domain-containing protein [Actinomycetota bacterium]
MTATQTTAGGNGFLLEARGIDKNYGHVRALADADFDVLPGEVTALVGDNGAGKSTLIKILSGTVQPDAGEIRFEGRTVHIDTPITARAFGLETVYQDLALAEELDPPANLFLGRELLRSGVLGRLGFLDKRGMRGRAEQAFASLGIGLQDIDADVGMLSGGQRQTVAVSRAATWASRVIFMDEPTAALGVVQAGRVLDLIQRIRESGKSVVLISHNLPHVFQVSNRIQVLRLGKRVATMRADDAKMDEVVGAMTGATADQEPA